MTSKNNNRNQKYFKFRNLIKKIYLNIPCCFLLISISHSAAVFAQGAESDLAAKNEFNQVIANTTNILVETFFKNTFNEEKFYFDKKIWFNRERRLKTSKILTDYLCLDMVTNKNLCKKEVRITIEMAIRINISKNNLDPEVKKMTIEESAQYYQDIFDKFRKTKDNSLLDNVLFKTKLAQEYLSGDINFRLESSDVVKMLHQFVEITSLDFQKALKAYNEKKPDQCKIISHQINENFTQNFAEITKIIQSRKPAVVDDKESKEIDSLIAELKINEPDIQEMLKKGKIQQAIWALRENYKDLEHQKQSELLENKVIAVIQSNDVIEERFLGGGINKTLLLKFHYGIKAVYKEYSLTNFISNHKNEIGAYLIDKLFNLKLVPITVEIQRNKKDYGSAQLFVPDTKSARDLNGFRKKGLLEKYLPKHIAKTFITPTGDRTQHPPYMVFFDWLIGNTDRNIDNYLYDNQSLKLVGIDHGWSFHTAFTSIRPSKNQLKAILKLDPSILNKIKSLTRKELFQYKRMNGQKFISQAKLEKVWQRIVYLQKILKKIPQG